MRRCLVPCLFLLLLSACASVPKTETPQAPVPQDFSRPNAYSVYHFLSGSFILPGEPREATLQFEKALSYDPASPQIKIALFRAQIAAFKRFSVHQERMLDILQKAREELQLSENDLIDMLEIYTLLQKPKDMDWAIAELQNKHNSTNAQLLVYNHRYLRGEIGDKKAAKKILDLADEKSFAAYILASVHFEDDPEYSLELLQKYPGDQRSNDLLLEILIAKQDFRALTRIFEAYRYPEDTQKMLLYMGKMQQHKLGNMVTQHSRKIIATKDKALIATLAEIAFFADAVDSMPEIIDFLFSQPWEPAADAQIASVLLAYAIQNEDAGLPLAQLSERITSLDRAYTISHYYLYKNMDAFNASQDEAKAEFDRRVQALIPDPALRGLLLSINYNREQAPDNQPALLFAQSLVQRKLAGRAEYTMLLADLHQHKDDEELITTLRQAIQAFPNDALFLNDLGYTLLSYPEHLPEAERLLNRAYALEPTDGAILDSVAWLKYIQGDFPAAARYAAKIKDLFDADKLDPEVHYHLGMIHLAMGDTAAAASYLEALLETDYHLLLSEAIEKAKQ
jgi:Flp pilus assembly protein TadD